MGHWLAYFLTRSRRMSVLVVERDNLGYGASTRNAGFLSSGNVSEWLLELTEQGDEATLHNFAARRRGVQIVLNEFAGSIGLDRCGSADFDPITKEKSQLAARFNQFVTSQGGRVPYEIRSVQLGGRSQDVWFNRDDYAIHPVQLLNEIHQRVREQGVKFAYRTEVITLNDGLAVVDSTGVKQEVRYGHGYLCTNAFAPELHPTSTVEPGRGQILVTKPCRVPSTSVLGFMQEGHDYFRFVDGRILVGGGRHRFGNSEATTELATTSPVQQYLESLAQKIAGPIEIEVERSWAGVMGLPNGSHSSARSLETPIALDGHTEIIAGLGGWGVTLAPYLAELIASRTG